MQQCGELLLLIPAGCLPHTSESLGHVFPTLCPARVSLFSVPLGRTASLHALLRGSPLVVRAPRRCRVGGGALPRWPPSAAQTVRAVFPHTAFTKTHASEGNRRNQLNQIHQSILAVQLGLGQLS